MMAGGIAGAAAVRTWPFRVYSFPSSIVLASELTLREFNTAYLRELTVVYMANAGRSMAMEFDRVCRQEMA